MSNLSISPALNGTPSGSSSSLRPTRSAEDAQRDDPATAFNRVMERSSPRAERKVAVEAKSSTQDAHAKPKLADPARPQTAESPTETSEASGTDTAAAPTTATGDLFAAELGLALAIARPVDTQLEAQTKVADPTKAAADPALASALAGGEMATGKPNAVQTEITADELVGVPAQRGPAIEGDATLPTRTAPRSPRATDARAALLPKFGVDAASTNHTMHERSTAESGAVPAATLEFRAAPTARSEAAPGLPLSLSAALAAGTPPAWSGNQSLAPTYSMAHTHVGTPVGSAGFNEDFGQRVVLLAGQRVQSAEIALTPSDLGPISVSMEVRGQEASLLFGAAQSTTRAAIEDALPRLREMFQAQGLHLVDAHVGAQVGHQARRDGSGNGASRTPRDLPGERAPIGGATTDPSTARSLAVRSDRLIDVRV